MPDDEGLREELAQAMWAADAGLVSYTWQDVAGGARTKWHRLADAVLATPVVAEALAAQEAMPRVRAALNALEDQAWTLRGDDSYASGLEVAASEIRRALDGES